MPRRPPATIERPGEIPLASLRYTVTPALVHAVAWASRSSGAIEGMRLSYFGQKRLEAEANKLRIAQLVARSGKTVRLDEIAPVLAGAVLPPRKRIVMTRIRQAAVLCEAARYYARRSDPTTPDDTAIDHELRAGGFDPYGLLVLAENERGEEALSLRRDVVRRADDEGDLTEFLEHFAHHLGLAISDLYQKLERHQDREEHLPWLMVRPPDELDRQIFEAVERSGSLTSPKIIAALPEPRPPLRTLQRRLQRLVHDGLLVKHGARRNAHYRVAERF